MMGSGSGRVYRRLRLRGMRLAVHPFQDGRIVDVIAVMRVHPCRNASSGTGGITQVWEKKTGVDEGVNK